ncbi:MAG: PqqD family protein [Bryobacterales bacterium]|nr:PqqD family protein [Bryobacterales bacterium]
MISRSDRFIQLPGTLSTASAGETILVNLTTGRFYGLSPSASLVWAALAEPRTRAEVISGVLQQQRNPPPAAEKQLALFLDELQHEGLIVEATPDAPEPAPLPLPAELQPYTAPRLDRGTLSQAANGVSGNDDGNTTGLGSTAES